MLRRANEARHFAHKLATTMKQCVHHRDDNQRQSRCSKQDRHRHSVTQRDTNRGPRDGLAARSGFAPWFASNRPLLSAHYAHYCLRTSQLYFCHFAGNKQKCAIIFAKRFFLDFNHLLFSGYSAHCFPSFSGSHFSCSLPLDPEHYVNVY